LFLTYSRNDQTQYGTDSGNAWPEYVKINGEDGFTYPSSRYDYMNGRSKSLGDYADAIKRVCGRYGIKVVDMYGDCPINPEVTAHVRAFIPDGTHPTPAGHELMGKYAAGAVAQVIP
jgi:lysophospholipase L1-like esterase